jgi:hypothetical protein
MNWTFKVGMIYFVPYEPLSSKPKGRGSPEMQGPHSNPFKGKLTNYLPECATLKENTQELVQIPAYGNNNV